MIAAFFGALLLAALPAPPASYGSQLYVTYCSTCHSGDAAGSAQGPSLHGIGMASLDFYLMTGRMPAAEPWLQVSQRGPSVGQQLDQPDIRAIEAYLAPVVAGGPTIPMVLANGNLHDGKRLYELNCMHCHGATGDGGDLGALNWAPNLHDAAIEQLAEAVRTGPGQMPVFGPHELSQSDLDDIASYVMTFDAKGQPADVPPFRSTGPLPEGAAAWGALVVILIFIASYWKSEESA